MDVCEGLLISGVEGHDPSSRLGSQLVVQMIPDEVDATRPLEVIFN